MKYPEEYKLMAVFETEPILLDEDIPYYYNQSTYKYLNVKGEEITFSITPSYNEVYIKVSKESFEIARLSFQSINTITILNDNKLEKRIMLTGEKYVLKFQLKPRFSIEFVEEKEQ